MNECAKHHNSIPCKYCAGEIAMGVELTGYWPEHIPLTAPPAATTKGANMSTVELPPLPEATNFQITFTDKAQIGNTVTTPLAYTADQMRAYASQAVDAALEEAAKLTETRTVWNDWDQQQLAAAIRALKAKP